MIDVEPDIYTRLLASIAGYSRSHGGVPPSRLVLGRQEWRELMEASGRTMGRQFVYGVYVVEGNW